jgi:hypothetical protein
VADGVRVETDGLNKFSNQVQNDTSATLDAGYSRASVDLSAGVTFGAANASGGVHAAKQRYVDALIAHTNNVHAYMDAARILADAAAKVAAAVEETDGRAGKRADEVRGLMAQAVTDSRKRQAEIDGRPYGGGRAV